jgi:hypothetical protein
MPRRTTACLLAAALHAALTTTPDAASPRETRATGQAATESREATTGADGTFTLSLPAGVYTVTVDNVTEERARLSLDQERGTRARIGFLTNPPRTFGVTTRVGF